jgi:hypothetical protein
MANVYSDGGRLRVLDWGDASISHPFASLLVTFRFLEEVTRLQPEDPWFARLHDAYLEPWAPVSPRFSASRCASRRSRMRSHGLGSVTIYLRRRGRDSTRGSR